MFTAKDILIILALLPAVLFLYWRIAHSIKSKLYLILFFSILVLALLEPRVFIYPLILSNLIFLLGRHAQTSKVALVSGIVFPLVLMIFFKELSPVINDSLTTSIVIPLGLSYYCFKYVHYMIERHRGNLADAGLLEFHAYILFFPMFLSGPIERLGNFHTELQSLGDKYPDWESAIERIVWGSIKVFLLAELLSQLFYPDSDFIQSMDWSALSWSSLLFVSFTKFLMIYLNFSGYTDIAIGTGLLFGIRLMENFNFPILRPNLAEFWRSWHISLSSWARDYVYMWVLGRYRTLPLALLATMLTIGLWHGVQAGWVLWGLHHGFGLVALNRYQRWARNQAWLQRIRNTRIWFIISLLTTWMYVSLGHSLTIVPDSLSTTLTIYTHLWGLGDLFR